VLNEEKDFGVGGHTYLTYVVFELSRNKWVNLIQRLRNGIDLRGNVDSEIYDEARGTFNEDVRDGILEDLKNMANLRRGQELEITNPWVRFEVEIWATNQFQGVSRSLTGLLQYQDSFPILAEISYHDVRPVGQTWEDMISGIVTSRLQHLFGYQLYQDVVNAAGRGSRGHQAVLNNYIRFAKKFPELEMCYLWKQDGVFYSVHSKGLNENNNPNVLERRPYEGNPVYTEGKPANQIHMLPYLRCEHMQQMDENQDMFIEDTFFMPNLLQEFAVDEDVAWIGFPEVVYTENFSSAGAYDAHADRTFNFIGQDSLDALGKGRKNYGHPDVWRVVFIKSMSRFSKSYHISEDYFSGGDAQLVGKKVKMVRFIKGGKAREVGFTGVSAKEAKFSTGGAHIMHNRMARDFRDGRIMGNWFVRVAANLTDFYGGPGFYIKEPIVRKTNLLYALWLVYAGISAFAAFPLEISLALIGLLYSQAGATPGLSRLILDHSLLLGRIEKRDKFALVVSIIGYGLSLYSFGFSYAALVALAVLILSPGISKWFGYVIKSSPFFMSQVLVHGDGVDSGQSGLGSHISTGRSDETHHRRLFKGDGALYQLFERSHLTPSLVGGVLSALGIFLFWNPSLILSGTVFLFFMSGYYALILMNPGSTPASVRMWRIGY